MDLAFIVDNSGSIRDKNKDGDNYDRLKGFLANLVDQLDIGIDKTRVGTVRFSDIAEVEFRLDTFTDKVSKVFISTFNPLDPNLAVSSLCRHIFPHFSKK